MTDPLAIILLPGIAFRELQLPPKRYQSTTYGRFLLWCGHHDSKPHHATRMAAVSAAFQIPRPHFHDLGSLQL